MRLLFTIPHFFVSQSTSSGQSSAELIGKHGSVSANPEKRIKTLRKTIYSLHQTFGQSQAMIRHADRSTSEANRDLRSQVHIVVITTGESHLLHQAGIPPTLCHHASADDDPTTLGYHCHRVLRDRWGNYDYYGYLEDDLALTDPWFFEKLRWFNSHVGDGKVLLPNRYERADDLAYKKCYLDGDLRAETTKPFQDVSQNPELQSTVLGRPVRFVRPLNPHSGCFFLNSAQMKTWTQSSDFGIPSKRFIGPLESAATLGVMTNFQIYKPAPENASFLEIEHDDCQYIRMIRMATETENPQQ